MGRTKVVSGFERRAAKGFSPRFGGDGGMPATNLAAVGAAIDRIGARRFTYRNSAVLLSGAYRRDCLPTQDPFDRAHIETSNGRDPKLLPAAEITKGGTLINKVHSAVPREYHKSEFHEPAAGVRVHQEQVFDDTHERMRRLELEEGTSQAGVRTRATIVLGASLRGLLRRRTRR